MKLSNTILNLCLAFVKQLWFIFTIHLYSYINNIQLRNSNNHNIETVDEIIKYYADKHKDNK